MILIQRFIILGFIILKLGFNILILGFITLGFYDVKIYNIWFNTRV